MKILPRYKCGIGFVLGMLNKFVRKFCSVKDSVLVMWKGNEFEFEIFNFLVRFIKRELKIAL